MPDYVEHRIQAGNPIMGSSQFFTLHLPPAWNLTSGAGHPEIVASHERREIKWVVNGNFYFILFDGQRRWAMEFIGRLRPISDRPLKPAIESASVSGHPAGVRWTTRRRGLPWRRHDITYMMVDYDCPYSERRVSLEFSGVCPEEGFREVLAALKLLRCH